MMSARRTKSARESGFMAGDDTTMGGTGRKTTPPREAIAGRFAVNGEVGFTPVEWNLKVLAREFNPGAVLAGWYGRVNLDLATRGQMRDAGPAGREHHYCNS